MARYLERAAESARANGYRDGNAWETMLDRHVKEHCSTLRKTLGDDYSNWKIVQTNEAIELMIQLIQEGTPPARARQLALSELLPLGDDENETSQPETGDTTTGISSAVV